MAKIKIYLDNCCFNRPYDDQSHLSIFLETQAKLGIQDLIEEKIVNLVWSFILDFENSENPDEVVKNEILLWRSLSFLIVSKNDLLVSYAENLNCAGFSKKDALHIAAAVDAKADYFITVDKGLIHRKRLVDNIKIVNPIELVSLLEEYHNEI